MTLQQIAPLLVVLLAACVAAMAYGAGTDSRALVSALAAGFISLVIVTALWVNVPVWRRPADHVSDKIGYVRRNTRLAAMIYAWGAAAMFAIYHGSGLSWRHGWQYGLAMALIATGLILYVRRLGTHPKMPPVHLTVLHALAALAALGYLISSGKLATAKGDWAANDVFLYGLIGLVAVCVIAAVTQKKLNA